MDVCTVDSRTPAHECTDTHNAHASDILPLIVHFQRSTVCLQWACFRKCQFLVHRINGKESNPMCADNEIQP